MVSHQEQPECVAAREGGSTPREGKHLSSRLDLHGAHADRPALGPGGCCLCSLGLSPPRSSFIPHTLVWLLPA